MPDAEDQPAVHIEQTFDDAADAAAPHNEDALGERVSTTRSPLSQVLTIVQMTVDGDDLARNASQQPLTEHEQNCGDRTDWPPPHYDEDMDNLFHEDQTTDDEQTTGDEHFDQLADDEDVDQLADDTDGGNADQRVGDGDGQHDTRADLEADLWQELQAHHAQRTDEEKEWLGAITSLRVLLAWVTQVMDMEEPPVQVPLFINDLGSEPGNALYEVAARVNQVELRWARDVPVPWSIRLVEYVLYGKL